MNDDNKINDGRRHLLLTAAAVTGGAAAVATCTPFVASMNPSEGAKAAGAPVEVDIGKLRPGDIKFTQWRGKPVWILRRTQEQIEKLQEISDLLVDPDSEKSVQPGYCKNGTRSIKPDLMVAINVCTHLGCAPLPKFAEGAASGLGIIWPGGFYCPCHGSEYDLAGRVFKNKLAPRNLDVPPYRYLSDTRILIGKDKKEA